MEKPRKRGTMKLIYKLRSSAKFKKYISYALLITLIAYVFSIPSFSNRSGYNVITYALMVAFAIITLFYCFLYRSFKLHPVSFILPAFALFAFIGTAIYSKNFRGWLSLILLAISLILFLYAFSALKNRYSVLRAVAIGLFIFTLYYFYVYRNQIFDLSKFGRENFRLGYEFDNPNGVASYMVISFGACLSLILFSKNKFDYLFALPILTTLWVGFSTGSKTFILAIGIFIVVTLFFKFKKYKWIYLLSLAALAGLFVLLINMPFMETIKARFIHFFETLFGTAEKVDTSSVERMLWMQYGFNLGAKNIITGYGYAGFGIYSGVGTYTHSNISEVFCDFGIIGFLLFYSPLLICFISSIKRNRLNLSLVVPFFFYYMLVSFSNVFYYNKTYYLMIALITYCCFEEEKKRSIYKTPKMLEKVLFTCDSMNSGGAERVISILANQMVSDNLDVSILMISNHQEQSFYQLNDSVHIDCLCKDYSGKVGTFKRLSLLRKYLKDKKPSVIVSFLPHVSVYTYFANLGLDTHHVVSERSDPKNNPKNKILRLLKNIVYKVSNGGVFQSEYAQQYFGSAQIYKGIVINNPIVVNNLYKTDYKKINYTILSVGRFTEEKNTKLLINSFSEIKKKIPEAKLKLYGDGPLKEELENLVNNLSLSDVTFCGNNTEWLKQSIDDSLFVLASNYEGMPNALIESLIAGLPCIATDCPYGVVSNIIQDGKNGFLVECNNQAMLVEKILKVLNMKEQVQGLCKCNKDLINEFDPNTITIKWETYLSNVLVNNYEK